MSNVIWGYMKDEKNQRVGILLGVRRDDGKIFIGGSKANTKVDKFDRDVGFNIALERAKLAMRNQKSVSLPANSWADVQHFSDRCSRYFQTTDVVLPQIKDYTTKKG